MANKKKRVDIVSVHIESLVDGVEAPSFTDLLSLLFGKVELYESKIYEFRSLATTLENCKIGLVETIQDKDIPPIKNKETKAFSKVQINTAEEGLAFGNVFLYNTRLQVLIYEVNKNGCYLQTLKELLEKEWIENNEGKEINIVFAAVCRLDEYHRILQMINYRKICYEICSPSEVLNALNVMEDSVYKNLLKSQLDAANDNNINVISIEQKCNPIKINREGIQVNFARGFAGLFNRLCVLGQKKNIKKVKIHGYTLDPESEKQRTVTIDLLADVFDEYITIPEVQVQSSLQVDERKLSIEQLHGRVYDELSSILSIAE